MTESPFSADTLKELNLPLNPDRVSVLTDGPSSGTPYLDGEDVTRRANEIFGYGNWGFELTGHPVCVESERKQDGKRDYEVWTAHGRMHVRGAMPIADLGTCVRYGEKAGGLEMAIKGCVTDAMKRCLKQLGDQFGLVLYDKEMSSAELRRQWAEATGQSAPPAAPAKPEPAALETESYAVVFASFVAQCKAISIGQRGICSALGFEAENADQAKTFMETEGPEALRTWEKEHPGRFWHHLVSQLADLKAAEQQRAMAS